jgi:ribosomal-protein-alanine N-acetyltransferase
MFLLELSKPSTVSLAARRDGRIVGYLICSRYEDAWNLMNISVDPEYRLAGIGSRLLGTLLEQKGEEAQYTLEVRQSNEAAIALYERHGFWAVGRRLRYYQDNGEDAVIMWRTPGTRAGTLVDIPGLH